MDTKAQDTVHAKYYKQQIESGTKYKVQKEALEQLRENREYCDKVLSTESFEERVEAVIKDLQHRRLQESQALYEAGMRGEIMRHYILEGYRNDIKVVL